VSAFEAPAHIKARIKAHIHYDFKPNATHTNALRSAILAKHLRKSQVCVETKSMRRVTPLQDVSARIGVCAAFAFSA